MKYFNLFVVMVILCAFQWNVVSAKAVVKFPKNSGPFNLYNKQEGNIKEITNCRLDVTNKNIICHAYYKKNVKICNEKDMCTATYFMDYDLYMPVTRYTGNSCKLTNGSTFKSAKLMAQNKNNNWAQVQSLANYKIIIKNQTPYLPKTMKLSTPQRFDFITSNGCKFSAHYEQVNPGNLKASGIA